jgi:hypothetical protein
MKSATSKRALAFRVGDRVWYADTDASDTGTVTSVDSTANFPYVVSWDDGSQDDWFAENQLVLVDSLVDQLRSV